jgi:hypothetical protein
MERLGSPALLLLGISRCATRVYFPTARIKRLHSVNWFGANARSQERPGRASERRMHTQSDLGKRHAFLKERTGRIAKTPFGGGEDEGICRGEAAGDGDAIRVENVCERCQRYAEPPTGFRKYLACRRIPLAGRLDDIRATSLPSLRSTGLQSWAPK